ncbi:MAG: hypothetical protein JST47_14600 [Bacteroidetes bacterium]|nr:hypothetical protein [Bacteroidota bacterium]MBS1973690.1 hypothetical protein [Bacteroidota bacterium]
MFKKIGFTLSIIIIMTTSCNNPNPGQKAIPPETSADTSFPEGSFGYDLHFLKQHDSVVVLKDESGHSKIIVSPKYQAKVFTSTANGDGAASIGWVNYKAFGDTLDPHMNAYGGENRFWLGPEGGKFSLFFKPGAKMVFENWKTPAAFDSEPWDVTNKDGQSVTMHKNMELTNYKGTDLKISVNRTVKILQSSTIENTLGITVDTSVKVVAYETDNVITNAGKNDWTESSGMPCIWILDMFKPSAATVIVVPFKNAAGEDFSKVATTNYFGEIPADRLKHMDDVLYFKADGKSRGKLGVSPLFAKYFAGSYDSQNKLLTIINYDLDSTAKYLNQEWNTAKPSFVGDAVNAYNDGPLANGTQMGPFYEIESVSPAAFLKSGQSFSHRQSVFHFTGEVKSLDHIAKKLLGVSLSDIEKVF